MDIFTTPREVALLRENDILKERIRKFEWDTHLETIQGIPVDKDMSLTDILPVVTLPRQGFVHAERDSDHDIRVTSRYLGSKGLCYSYFASAQELLSVNDQTTLLSHLHLRLIRELATALENKQI